jgi:acyl-CoA thioesterase FadM
LHEGRVQLLEALGYTEKDVAGVALIMSELHVKYTKQAFYPGVFELDLSVTNLRPTRFDIFYRGYDRAGDLLLLAKTEMAGLDTKTGKPVRLPDAFARRFREQE